MGVEEILKTQELIKREIFVSDKILEYILNVIEATRSNQYFSAGLSTRGPSPSSMPPKPMPIFPGRTF